jgi:protein SCO1/2
MKKIFTLLFFLLTTLPANLLAIDNSSLKGLRVEPPKAINPAMLINHNGKSEKFPAANKRWRLVFFGYTSCPDICPTTMFTVSQAVKQLGDEAKKLQVVFVSVDGQRDKPEDISRFIGFYGKDILGLTGDIKEVNKISKQFGITTRKFQGRTALAYTLQHSIYLYLLDPKGRIRYMYTAADSPKMISGDLKILLSKTS